MSVLRAVLRHSPALVAVSLLAACSSDESTGPLELPPETTQVFADASTATVYLQLGDTVRTVNPSNPGSSTDWDFSVFRTAVALNSGAGGSGSVTGYCLCQNAALTPAEVQALDAAPELAAFDAVTAAQIPADSEFTQETLVPRITGWFTGSGASAQANTGRTFVIIRSRVLPIPQYGKFRVVGISGATSTSPGSVTFEYAMQASSNGALPDVRTATVTVGASPVYFDLVAGVESSAASTWDIRFEGFLIRANSGASGGAGHIVAPPQDAPFGSFDLTALRAFPNSAFGQDALGGPFGARTWYYYNFQSRQVYPNFNVYLIKKGSQVFKVQLSGYYGLDGKEAVVTVRSERLR